MSETGHISIHAENILPIIKKWLYNEKEIFLREAISNSSDALMKLHKLSLIGETDQETPEPKITIEIDKDKSLLKITDTGLGMTDEEVKKYINQVAFSGLQDFVEKYQDKDDSQQIIGHFGLGFYSLFMVSDRVEIDTLSYRSGAKAAHWECDGSTEFTLSDSERKEIGTTITLHISEDSKELLEEYTIKTLLNKYCAFIRYPIHMGEDVVNDPTPIWTKSPTELKDEDYIEFFHKVFPACEDPLFWIHLNLDYPFNLSGVLYFPRLNHELSASQGEVKLYCNQVYVADNVKELIPEFLTLLKGAIDSPDIPLNVSRSFLQNDPTVRKINQHIIKKVADKLSGLAKTDRENYEKYWEDINPFVKFGMLQEQKFAEKMRDHVIFKSSIGGYKTCEEYTEAMKGKVDEEGTVLYATDETKQASYLRMLEDQKMEAVITNTVIDSHFIPYFESQSGGKIKFKRVDSAVVKELLSGDSSKIVDPKDNKTNTEKIEKIFADNLTREKVKVSVENFKDETVPAMLVFDENMRRIKEMADNGMFGAMKGLNEGADEHNLVVNQNSSAVKNLISLAGALNKKEEIKLIVNQIYDLAFLQQGGFTPEMMRTFIERSTTLLGKISSGEPAPANT